MPTSLNLVKGIGPATAEKLADAGVASAEDLAASTPDQLAAVPGFGESRAKQVIAHARQLVTAASPAAVVGIDAKPTAGKKGADKSKTGKASKKSESKKKVEKKKGKKDKLKKNKSKVEKGKKEKSKKVGEKKKARKKKR